MYQIASEAIREALRLLKERDDKYAVLPEQIPLGPAQLDHGAYRGPRTIRCRNSAKRSGSADANASPTVLQAAKDLVTIDHAVAALGMNRIH